MTGCEDDGGLREVVRRHVDVGADRTVSQERRFEAWMAQHSTTAGKGPGPLPLASAEMDLSRVSGTARRVQRTAGDLSSRGVAASDGWSGLILGPRPSHRRLHQG